MVDLVYCLTNLLCFDILLLCYCNNVRSSIVFGIFFGDVYLSLGISLSCSFVILSELFCCKFFVTLLAFLLPITSLVASPVSLLYYYINLSSSIISCLFSGDTYLYLGISLSCLYVTVSELFCDNVFEVFVILSAILLPIKSLVASPAF